MRRTIHAKGHRPNGPGKSGSIQRLTPQGMTVQEFDSMPNAHTVILVFASTGSLGSLVTTTTHLEVPMVVRGSAGGRGGAGSGLFGSKRRPRRGHCHRRTQFQGRSTGCPGQRPRDGILARAPFDHGIGDPIWVGSIGKLNVGHSDDKRRPDRSPPAPPHPPGRDLWAWHLTAGRGALPELRRFQSPDN